MKRVKAPPPPRSTTTSVVSKRATTVKAKQRPKPAPKPTKLFGKYDVGPEILAVHGLSRERFDRICKCLDALMDYRDISSFCEVPQRLIRIIATKQLHKPLHKIKDGGFGSEVDASLPTTVDWRKAMTQQYGDDGLPITFPDLTGLQRPAKAPHLPTLLLRLSQLSRAELQHICDYQTLDGRGISVGILMYAQLALDCTSFDSKTRNAALKLFADRMHGSALQRLGNADGSNLDPMQALIDTRKARWQPVEIEADIQDDQ